jgi:hypothetical protein
MERRFSYDSEEMMREISQLYPERIVKPLMDKRNQVIVKSQVISELLGDYSDDTSAEDEVSVVKNG